MTLSDACKTALRQRAWDQMLVWLRLRAHIRAALENCDE